MKELRPFSSRLCRGRFLGLVPLGALALEAELALASALVLALGLGLVS